MSGGFDEIIRIGIDKNGQADFRISMRIMDADQPTYKALIEMIPWATAEAIEIWRVHSPNNPERNCAQTVREKTDDKETTA